MVGLGSSGVPNVYLPSSRIETPCVHLALSTGGRHLSLSGSHLLIAAGRRPNTDDLGLKKAGVAVDAKGFVEVDDGLRTSVEGIGAMGDVHGRGAFTHTSWNDYEIVAANLLDGEDRKVSDRIPVYGLFTRLRAASA